MILEEEKWPKQFCSRKSWQIEKDRALFPAKRGRKLESEWQLLLWPWEKIQSTSTNNVFILPTGWGHIMDQFPKLKILFCFCQFAGQVGYLTPCSLYKFQVPFKWKKNFMFSPPDVCKNQHFKMMIVNVQNYRENWWWISESTLNGDDENDGQVWWCWCHLMGNNFVRPILGHNFSWCQSQPFSKTKMMMKMTLLVMTMMMMMIMLERIQNHSFFVRCRKQPCLVRLVICVFIAVQ